MYIVLHSLYLFRFSNVLFHFELCWQEWEPWISYDQARLLLSELFCGVNELHTIFDVMHKDLKWENIIIDDDEHIKIIDFGFAKIRSSVTIENTITEHDIPEEHKHLWYMMLDIYKLADMVNILKIYNDSDPYVIDEHIKKLQDDLVNVLLRLSVSPPATTDFFPGNSSQH